MRIRIYLLILIFLKIIFKYTYKLNILIFNKNNNLNQNYYERIRLFSNSEIKNFILNEEQFSESDQMDLLTRAITYYRKKGLNQSVEHLIHETTYGRLYFSQEGEDIVMQRLFSEASKGFYVDIGAHHPIRYSNTYKLYLQGWNGINVDATPGSMKAFNEIRPLDINLEVAISSSKERKQFYQFKEGALNTFNMNLANKYIKIGHNLQSRSEIKSCTLEEILDNYMKPNQEIDLLSVDVEGHEIEVLKSNNWNKYSPKIIIIEDLSSNFINNKIPISVKKYLEELNYNLLSQLYNSQIFKRNY